MGKMTPQHIDIMPCSSSYNNIIEIGTTVEIVVDSQFNDNLTRRYGQKGHVISEQMDEWGYEVQFLDGGKNWFKRYHLKASS